MDWTPGDKPYHEAMSRSGTQAHRERLKYSQAYPHDLAIELYIETLAAEPPGEESFEGAIAKLGELYDRAGKRGKAIIEDYRNRLIERSLKQE